MKIISVPDNKTYCTVILIIEKMSLRIVIHLKAGKIFRISLEKKGAKFICRKQRYFTKEVDMKGRAHIPCRQLLTWPSVFFMHESV